MKLLIFDNYDDILKLEDLGVVIDFEPEDEDMSPHDSMEKESADYVVQNYDNGNAAAWFCAKVTVSFKGYEATDYLGGCSYSSFEEFTGEREGYYEDMISTCIRDINNAIDADNFEIQKRWNIRKAINLIKEYGLFIAGPSRMIKEVTY